MKIEYNGETILEIDVSDKKEITPEYLKITKYGLLVTENAYGVDVICHDNAERIIKNYGCDTLKIATSGEFIKILSASGNIITLQEKVCSYNSDCLLKGDVLIVYTKEHIKI